MNMFKFIYIAYDNGSRIPGTRLSPFYINQSMNINKDYINYNLYNENYIEAIKNLQISQDMFFDKLPLVIGGDHSITYMACHTLAVNKYRLGKILLIFDAHIDFYPNYDAKVKNWNFIEKILLENLFEDIYILGVREHIPLINDHIHIVSVNEIKKDFNVLKKNTLNKIMKQEVSISIDVDVIDPAIFPGVSYPLDKGLEVNVIKKILSIVFETCFVKYIDIVEFNPMVENKQSLKEVTSLINYILGQEHI